MYSNILDLLLSTFYLQMNFKLLLCMTLYKRVRLLDEMVIGRRCCWTKWPLNEVAIGRMVIGRSGYWTKWSLAEVAIGQSGHGRNDNGRNGFGRNGDRPFGVHASINRPYVPNQLNNSYWLLDY